MSLNHFKNGQLINANVLNLDVQGNMTVEGGSYSSQVSIGANITLDSLEHSGRVLQLNNVAGGYAITLPTANDDENQGAVYELVCSADIGGGNTVTVTSPQNNIRGVLMLNNAVAPVSGTVLTVVAGTATLGTTIKLTCVDGVYSALLFSNTAGSITVA
jgi:hypothetical protein